MQVTLTSPDLIPGTVATYSCREGFVMAEDISSDRKCQTNGEWSSDEPNCIGTRPHHDIMRHKRTRLFDGVANFAGIMVQGIKLVILRHCLCDGDRSKCMHTKCIRTSGNGEASCAESIIMRLEYGHNEPRE